MPALVLRPAPRRVANPKADPRFVAVTEQVKAGANKLKKHAPPAQKACEASKSAKTPPNERLAGAKAKVVDAVKEAPAPKPQPSSFKALLRAEIEKAMPKTLGDTEKFMKGEQAGAMKGSLAGNVGQQKETATGPVDAATKKAPDPGSVPATPSAALPPEPAPQAPPVAGGEAMPPPVTPAEASLEQSKKDTAQALADEKIKPESLPRANDPRFSAVAAAQQQVAAQADKAPAAFRAKESAILGGARAQAGGIAARGSLLLAGTRGRGNAQVLTRQQQQAQKEEEARRKVATDIEAIFNRTKSKVETRLANLDNEVAAIFDPGVDAALNTMKSYVDARIDRYKLERYLTIPIVGLARWLRDQALGLPEEVNAFYVQGRAVFQAAMDRLIDRIANLVETRLAQAKADVAAGQAEIKSYVAGLPANLKAAGQAAEKAMGDRFAELTTSIEDKKNELASSLAQKYKEAFDKADEALKQMQDENKGLLQQFAEKLGEVLKALAEFKARLMAVLRKGADTINRILEDPGQFLSNLLAAIKQGFQQFAGNILTHLARGFAKWLFGALAGAGIEIPSDLTLPSILKLVLGVLGITYERMRAKAVRLLGPTVVGIIEKVVEYVRALITGGPAALWEKVKEDLSDLKAMVIDAIKDWLIATIVKRAVAKVVSMFNPVGAIIQIILMIVSVVQFVIERAAQIMEFVEAVVNSFAAIASGAVGGAASWIERALGNMVPILIGFLASLLGLGGISAKIKETILKVQNKVDKAIDKAIAKIVGVVKKLFGKLTGKDKKDAKPAERTDAEKLEDLKRAVSEAQQAMITRDASPKQIKKLLPRIQQKYRLASLVIIPTGKTLYRVRAKINPDLDSDPPVDLGIDDAIIPDGVWDEAMQAVIAGRLRGRETRLSDHSVVYNRSVLMGLVHQSSMAGPAAKAQVTARMLGRLEAARRASDGDAIYNRLREAAAPVKDLYPQGALSLQVHHVQGVKENPEVFLRTRAQRNRRKINAQIAKLPPKEAAKVTPAVVRLWIEQILDADIEARPGTLSEVEMIILTQAAHLGQKATGRLGVHSVK